MVNVVEIYPWGKTCWMKCPGCNLTDTHHTISNTLDEIIKKSFEKVQEILTMHNTERVLDYTFPLSENIIEPIPTIDITTLQQILLYFGEIEKNCIVSSNETIITSMKTLDMLMKNITHSQNTINKFINTKIWFTPQTIITSKEEIAFLFRYFDEYQKFIQANRYSWWIIWLEYNMVSTPTIKKNLYNFSKEKNIFDKHLQSLYMKSKNRDTPFQLNTKEELMKTSKIAEYSYSTNITINDIMLWFSKRVLTRLAVFTNETYKIIAERIVQYKAWHSISIYNHGVMINHTPFTINNAFLRVSHERFLHFLNTSKPSKNNLTITPQTWSAFFDFSPLVEENLKIFNTIWFSDEHMMLVNPVLS